jgi:cellulose synthase operon protein C
MRKKQEKDPSRLAIENGRTTTIPLIARLAHEIPRPRDWQAFQRNSVLLFRSELNDPNAQEYGRGGQDQGGIDVLGKRNGNPDHYVGIQCRHVIKPLKEAKILADCRAALALKAEIKELIFATTAPNDTHATDAAIAVERKLRDEGYKLTVVIYGWEALQTLIASHEVAYAAFCPSIVASTALQSPLQPKQFTPSTTEIADEIVARMMEQMRQSGLVGPPAEVGVDGASDEDPGLHARIDTYRDLFRDQHELLIAEKYLLALLEKEPLDGKPWARFRIETNLGSIALGLGREEDGAARFEKAHSLRPNDPKAIANLALARTIQGDYKQAMELATQALNGSPRADHAVAYLLQAAARSNWDGNPASLIPDDLVGSKDADVGLAEFLRRRDIPGWAEQTLDICRRHPAAEEFQPICAIAVLAIALDAGLLAVGGRCPVTLAELNQAADQMKTIAERCLQIGFADKHDLTAYLNNAALLLRLCDRHSECESLLTDGIQVVRDDPQLRRLLALSQVSLERRKDALTTLAADDDDENRLLSAELTAEHDPDAALEAVLSLDPAKLDPRLAEIRFGLMGELALRTGHSAVFKDAITNLRQSAPNDVTASILELRSEKVGLDVEVLQDRLRNIASTLPDEANFGDRFILAEELRGEGLPDEAARLLEPYVDLNRPNAATFLYLESLASARRDEAFREALNAASPLVRSTPRILWAVASHAWNIGDLLGAYTAIEELLKIDPENASARLLKIEILVRQDRSSDLLAELDKPIELLLWTRLQDRFRVASLLGFFGYIDRAAELSYKLFLEHRDNSQAWMTLSMLVLELGREAETKRWDVPVVAPNVAIDLQFEDGRTQFLIVEPDAGLRRLDDEAWEPDHPLVQALIGLAAGDRFTDPNGCDGTIVALRHKYVARLHYVMERHEKRFPQIFGFRSIEFDPESPDGLDELIGELKARREWIEGEQERYVKGPWPLGILAHRLGLDVIEVAYGLASQGTKLKVALGNVAERNTARAAIKANQQAGCVLDLLAFWTAWKLQALDTIASVCGPIHLPQGILDRLRARREKIELSIHDGLRSAQYDHGKIAVREIPPETVRAWRDDVDQAIAWAERNAQIDPVVAGEELSASLRQHLREGRSDIFDSLVLAMHRGFILVSDDFPTRDLLPLFGGKDAVWLHAVFSAAVDNGLIDLPNYVRWLAYLVDAGHDYLGVSGPALVQALRMDATEGNAPGYLFTTLAKVIGGKNADPRSHVRACLNFLGNVWMDPSTEASRKPATSLLLRRLLHERCDDYGVILGLLLKHVKSSSQLANYVHGWARGHFIGIQ